jgi:hypothetical protein
MNIVLLNDKLDTLLEFTDYSFPSFKNLKRFYIDSDKIKNLDIGDIKVFKFYNGFYKWIFIVQYDGIEYNKYVEYNRKISNRIYFKINFKISDVIRNDEDIESKLLQYIRKSRLKKLIVSK